MSRRLCAALAVLAVLAGACVAFAPGPMRTAGGILLAFLLPGLALTTALFRDRISLTGIEKCMLIPALSLATLVLGGLAAWGLGFSLHRPAWLAVSELVTLVALGTAIVWPVPQPEPGRRRGVRHVQLPTPRDQTLVLPFFRDRELGFDAEPRWWRKLVPDRPGRTLVPLVLAVGMLVGAGLFAERQSVAFHDVRVTSLSATPPSPGNALGERFTRVTAAGLPSLSRTYQLLVSTSDGLTDDRREVHADAAGKWTAKVTIRSGERTRIALYEAGAAAPIRTLIVSAG